VRARRLRNPVQKAFCIGCGCSDYHACVDALDEPCHWLAVDYPAGVGVCSACPGELSRWNAGERDPRPETGA
jgi:hypothetical protein